MNPKLSKEELNHELRIWITLVFSFIIITMIVIIVDGIKITNLQTKNQELKDRCILTNNLKLDAYYLDKNQLFDKVSKQLEKECDSQVILDNYTIFFGCEVKT